MPKKVGILVEADGVADNVDSESLRYTLGHVIMGALKVHVPNLTVKFDGEPMEIDFGPFYDKWISEAACELMEVMEKGENPIAAYDKLKWMWQAKRFHWNPQEYKAAESDGPSSGDSSTA